MYLILGIHACMHALLPVGSSLCATSIDKSLLEGLPSLKYNNINSLFYSYSWKWGCSWPCFHTTLPSLLHACKSCCSYSNWYFFHNIISNKRRNKVYIKRRSTSASPSLKGYDTKPTTENCCLLMYLIRITRQGHYYTRLLPCVSQVKSKPSYNPGQNCWDNSIYFLTFAPYSRLL